MDRYSNLDLDLECEEGGGGESASEKGGKLKGFFKKPSKLFKEDDPLTTLSPPNLEESVKNDKITEKTSKESDGIFGGVFKKSPKPERAEKKSQEDLSAHNSLSGSSESLSKTKEKGGLFGGMFKKKGAQFQSQEDLTVDKAALEPKDCLREKPFKDDQSGTRSTFFTDCTDKASNTGGEEALDNESSNSGRKQNVLVGAMSKLNPFRSGNKSEKQSGQEDKESAESSEKQQSSRQKDTEDSETNKQTDEKPNQATGRPAQMEKRDKSETPPVPRRPPAEETKRTSTYDNQKPGKGHEKSQEKSFKTDEEETANNEEEHWGRKSKLVGELSKLNPFRSGNKTSDHKETPEKKKQLDDGSDQAKSNKVQHERRPRSEMPPVPPRLTEEEMKRPPENHNGKTRKTEKEQKSPDESASETPADPAAAKEESHTDDEHDEIQTDSKRPKVKQQKRHNPFMPRAAVKAESGEEELNDEEESSSKEEKKTEEETVEEKTEIKGKKPKKHNPFMPRVKAKVKRRSAEDEAAAETEGGNRSLFDQLEEFRVEPSQPEESQDVEDLMDWWNTVESWEDTPQDKDMTEKEEAKAFAVTAEKVQKGIRVFNKLFSERAEVLWQHVMDLNAIADGLDKFNKNTKIAQITGGSTSAIGGVATITGLALAPVTMGTSLIVTAVGLGVATAGGLTSAGAGLSNQVNNSMDRKKVERIVEDYQEKIADLNKCLKFIKQGIDNLRKFNLLKMKKHAYNQDFPALTSSFYEDGAMVGKAILINANEIMRVVQIANVAGSTAARAVQVASMATGVLTGLFVGMDIYFVAKDSKILKKGAKSEFAAKIREVSEQLHEGLVELNTIRMELQSTQPESGGGGEVDGDKRESCDKYSSSEEDEIDRIKREIKKEYV